MRVVGVETEPSANCQLNQKISEKRTRLTKDGKEARLKITRGRYHDEKNSNSPPRKSSGASVRKSKWLSWAPRP